MIHDAGLIIGDFCNGPLQKLINLISSEYISCIYLIFYIIKASIIAVSDDGIGLSLELGELIDYETAEECAAIFKGWLIDDDVGSLCLNALHNALYG